MRRFSLFLVFSLLFSTYLPMTVSAQPQKDVYFRAAGHTMKIALTFDDGPHPRYTDEILQVLESEGVKATFFTIGTNVRAYPEVTRRVIAAGHEIGNHTYTHPLVPLTTTAHIEEEIVMTDALLQSIGGVSPVFFRPPQGKFPPDKEGLLSRTGKIAVLWSIDTRDWEHKPAREIVAMVEREVCGGDIILFHDFVGGESQTIPAIKKLIPTLKERGYQFVTLSELLLEEG